MYVCDGVYVCEYFQKFLPIEGWFSFSHALFEKWKFLSRSGSLCCCDRNGFNQKQNSGNKKNALFKDGTECFASFQRTHRETVGATHGKQYDGDDNEAEENHRRWEECVCIHTLAAALEEAHTRRGLHKHSDSVLREQGMDEGGGEVDGGQPIHTPHTRGGVHSFRRLMRFRCSL